MTATSTAAVPRHARVLGRQLVTPRMARVTLGLDRPHDVADLTTGHPDDFVTLTLPDGSGGTVRRYYTLRRVDAATGELDVDLVLHGHGPAARWAATAVPGTHVTLDSPHGHYAPPPDAAWVALVGDLTALPAISRILDERGPAAGGPPVHVVVAAGDPCDHQALATRADDEVTWLPSGADLLAPVRRLTARPTPGYVWFSGEATAMRAVRTHLRHGLGWPVSRWCTMAYWRRDAERWERQLDRHGTPLRAALAEIYSSTLDPETQRDQAEEVLARHGL